MIEAVGERYWPAYFAKLRASLAQRRRWRCFRPSPSTSAALRPIASGPDFIQRYIFPGGLLPTASIIEREAARAGLKLVHRQSFGDSYAKTLREWRSRFLRAWPHIEPLGFNERFRRMWEYYLVYCEIGFRFGVIDVSFFKLAG